jgi:hypothetical protein
MTMISGARHNGIAVSRKLTFPEKRKCGVSRDWWTVAVEGVDHRDRENSKPTCPIDFSL